MALSRGDRIGRYTLLEPIGKGGQAVVWKAVDPQRPNHPRALKIVPLKAWSSATADRVRHEGDALSRLSHRSVVGFDALFEDAHWGLVVLSLELVDGPSLADAMRDSRFGAAHRIAALEHLASVLAYLHGVRVVHRDVKPGNVLLRRAFWDDPLNPSNLKLIDFGIASQGDPNDKAKLGARGTFIGTAPYMAPELVDAPFWQASVLEPAVDVFAFGVVGWQLLTGKHPSGLPSDAPTLEYSKLYRAASEGKRTWPAGELTGHWGVVLRRCLILQAADRPATGRAVLELARRMATSEGQPVPVAATTPVTPRRLPSDSEPAPGSDERSHDSPVPVRPRRPAPAPPIRKRSRARLALVLAGVVVLAACGVLALLLSGLVDVPRPAEEAAEEVP